MKGKTIWLYGLPSSGKTTIAKKLMGWGNFLLLDGDEVREALDIELGFSEEDRNKMALKYSKLCELVNNYNIDCILCTNSPSEKNRSIFRNNITNLLEVYVYCSLEICEKRDAKGLYKKARNQEIENMPGIDMKFEVPLYSDIIVSSDVMSIDECVKHIVEYEE